MAPAEPPAGLTTAVDVGVGVEVVCALGPHQVLRATLAWAPGATALQALRASGLAAQLPAGLLDTLALSIWGRPCTPGTLLQPGDRLELTRPLTVDPKEARRLRYRRDGVRKAPPRRRTAPS